AGGGDGQDTGGGQHARKQLAHRRLLVGCSDRRAAGVPTEFPMSSRTYGVAFSDGAWTAPGAVGGADNSGRTVNVSPSWNATTASCAIARPTWSGRSTRGSGYTHMSSAFAA